MEHAGHATGSIQRLHTTHDVFVLELECQLQPSSRGFILFDTCGATQLPFWNFGWQLAATSKLPGMRHIFLVKLMYFKLAARAAGLFNRMRAK